MLQQRYTANKDCQYMVCGAFSETHAHMWETPVHSVNSNGCNLDFVLWSRNVTHAAVGLIGFVVFL